MPGPVPKRSDQRVRRNTTEYGTIDKIIAAEAVECPSLGIEDVHPFVEDFYYSLRESAQSQYYEPSDWQQARLLCLWMDDEMKHGKGSHGSGVGAMKLSALHSMMQDLLVSEGSRRRVRLEIERNQAAAQVVDLSETFRQRQQGS